MRITSWLLPLSLCGAVYTGSAQAAVTEDSFLLRNTGDLVDTCTAAQTDPLYTAATNFCQGFAVGVFRVLQEQDMARTSRHMFCLPDPLPTRNQGIADFIQWAKADPSRMSLSAADGIATFVSQKFPCPRGR